MAQQQCKKRDVAIIGMSCRVAGADSPSKLWDNLAASEDVQSKINRWNGDGFYEPNGGKKKGITNVNAGYFIDDSLDKFDNAFFSIPPLEASAMDPQQRLLLELTYEAVENAGIPLESFVGTNTGVYTGMLCLSLRLAIVYHPLLTQTYRNDMERLCRQFVPGRRHDAQVHVDGRMQRHRGQPNQLLLRPARP